VFSGRHIIDGENPKYEALPDGCIDFISLLRSVGLERDCKERHVML